MPVVPESNPTSNPGAIERDLHFMTARWHELDRDLCFELRALKEFSQPQTARFNLRWSLGEAIDWARNLSGYDFNLYAVRNPIRGDCAHSATDADIVASCFLWADCDDVASGERVKKWSGPKYTAAVITGTIPDTRVHTYWALAEWCHDMDAWTATQSAIASHFGSDRSVVNPSRIMRLAGTVAHPFAHKRARGYVPEVATLRTEYPDLRRPVTLDDMARAFGSAAPASARQAGAVRPLQIDTGDMPRLDRQAALQAAMSGQDWHNNMVRLVASYVSRGMGDGEIHDLTASLTLPGWTSDQTARDVQTAIDGARKKGWTPQPQEYTPNFDHPPATPDAAAEPAWKLQQVADFVKDFVAPEYLIDGVIQRGRLYTLTAPTGSGKTAIMLHIGIAMSRGQPVCERETEQGDVIYMAGENPDDVRSRIIATMEATGTNPETCRLHFIPGTFSIRRDMALIHEAVAKLPNVTMVVVDTLAAYFDGDDTNNNAQMLDFARVLRAITTCPSKPAVIVPAHPVKNAAKTNLTPMGGSALLNEVDGNLCLWKRDAAVEMHWQGKHRGAEFDPLMFEIKGIESDLVRDSKGRIMPTVMAVPLLQARAMEIAVRAVTMEDRLLLNIEKYDAQSVAQRCVEIGLVNTAGYAKKSTMVRMLEKLKSEKLVERLRANWRLTSKGEQAVEIINNGGSIVDPDI